MSKTNKDLVTHAKKALAERWGYVWGTFGLLLTEKLLQQKINQYPDGVGDKEDAIRSKWMGRMVTDCVGLIKSCLWWDGSAARYHSDMDVSADRMYSLATVKGPISMIPETPGLCVWKKGHIGIYIGSRQVIEARGTAIGVIKSPLTGAGSAGWTHWIECPYIEYVKESEEEDVETVKGTIKGKPVEGFLKNGTTYVPLRAATEPFGGKVSWDSAKKTFKAE